MRPPDAPPGEAADKAQWRAWCQRRRRAQPPRPSPRRDAAVLSLLPESPLPGGWAVCYVSLPSEPPTRELRRALAARRPVALPRVTVAGLELVADPGVDATFATGTLGVGEPAGAPIPHAVVNADLFVVPALAVDQRGVRLGRGGGFYDRLLPLRRRGVLAVALLADDEFVSALPWEPHDARVDAVATPSGLIRLDGGA